MPRNSSATRHRRAAVIAILMLTLGIGAPLAASAEPTTPDTPGSSSDAQRRWLDASRAAAVLNEQVLQAQQALESATATADQAAEAVAEARREAADAVARAATADAELVRQQQQVDRFVNASFRGARLSPLGPLLTAESPDDLLDQVTALDRVAADAANTLDDALQARRGAEAAAEHRAHAVSEANQWQTAADEGRAAAQRAAADLEGDQAEMDRQAGIYRALYAQLTEQERQQALAEEEQRTAAAARSAARLAAPETAAAPPLSGPASPPDPQSGQDSAALVGAADAPVEGSQAGQAAVAAALSRVGSPYVWGAAGPDAFDCSGLTSWAWKQAGVTIPRTSREQQGLTPVPMDQLQPGDLITYYSPVSHVAMYIGNGQIVQASTPSRPVFVTDVYRGGPGPTAHRPQT